VCVLLPKFGVFNGFHPQTIFHTKKDYAVIEDPHVGNYLPHISFMFLSYLIYKEVLTKKDKRKIEEEIFENTREFVPSIISGKDFCFLHFMHNNNKIDTGTKQE
jgi:hypothetical protein